MKPSKILACLAMPFMLLVAVSALAQQGPGLLQYQGRVTVAGTNFTGTGQFKFALVDPGANTNQTALAYVDQMGGGVLQHISVNYGGCGYTTPPQVTLTTPLGTGAVLVATVSGGQVTGIVISNGGSGYLTLPTVTIDPPPPGLAHRTLWSHDASGSGGAAPATALSLPVAKGFYSVLLGDPAVPNMTAAIAPDVFTNADVRLRVWFSDGVRGFQQLAPDQRLAAAGYAMVAGRVPDGAITGSKLADGAVTSAKLSADALATVTLAPGAVVSNLAASGQAAVGRGGIVLSPTENQALVAAGYVRMGTTTSGESWQQRTYGTPPGGRSGHTAVWDGTEMIIWGGDDGASFVEPLADGARYNPAANTWSPMSCVGAPSPRCLHTAVWDGSEMIVWGGDGSGRWNDGGRYNPASNTWTPTPTNGAPQCYEYHSAVWDGKELLVWGGWPSMSWDQLGGGKFDPEANAWSPVSTNGQPAWRYEHAAVWDGKELLVWGGFRSGICFGDGGRYDPTTDSWRPISTNGAPSPRVASAVWDGHEMLVWGGGSGGGRYDPVADAWQPITSVGAPSVSENAKPVWDGSGMLVWGDGAGGGRYDPATDTWTPLPTAGAPPARHSSSVVWDGSEMLVWGGCTNAGASRFFFNDGARYNPGSQIWTPMSSVAAQPSARCYPSAVWDGSEMLVWGGLLSPFACANDGGRYNPVANVWTAITTNGAPSPRYGHAAVWDGREMIVWGGRDYVAPLGDGARYNPSANAWTPVSNVRAPSGRVYHTVVWDGSEIIVWGGYDSDYLGDGSRYDPLADTWSAMTAVGAPGRRAKHGAVWDGSGMIVWGGDTSNGLTNNGARYTPASDTWSPIATTGAPSARDAFTTVWDGGGMVVWGGQNGNLAASFNDGARYDPVANAWTALPIMNAPSGRALHTAVWSGTEMIVWGGYNWSYCNDGARYNPVANTWTYMNPFAASIAPVARCNHLAVWDGHEMIIWGGSSLNGWCTDTWCYTPGQTMFLYAKP